MSLPLNRLAVLVVDNCPDTADSTVTLLGLSGYDAEAVYRGTDALERLARRPFDVVLLDLAMPGMSGCDLVRQLPGRPSRPFLIAVTGCVVGPARQEALDAGVDLVLAKPATPAVIDGVLRRIDRFLHATAE